VRRWSLAFNPDRGASRSLAVLVLLVATMCCSWPRSAVAQKDNYVDWEKQVVARVAAIEEEGGRASLIEVVVDQVIPGVEWQKRQLRKSEVIGRVISVHSGDWTKGVRMVVGVTTLYSADYGMVLSGALNGPHAQLWLRPGDHILALATRPSESMLSADHSGAALWWQHDNWWEIVMAAQLQAEQVEVVTEVAPDWFGSAPEPETTEAAMMQVRPTAVSRLRMNAAQLTSSIKELWHISNSEER